MARRANKQQSHNASKQIKATNKQPPEFQVPVSTTASHPSLEEAQPPPSRKSLLRSLGDIRTQRSLQLILLASLQAAVSQLNLSPVYGAVPAALYHRYGLTVSFLVAFLLRGYLPPWVGRAITPFCFSVPAVQFVAFRFSWYLGNPLGPVLTECLTCYPLVALSVYMSLQYLDEINASSSSTSVGGADAFPAMGLFALMTVLQRASKAFVASLTGPGFLKSRIGMQLLIASLYGAVLPSNIIWPSLPAVAFTMVANPHCSLSRTTEVLNNTLALYDYTLLERKESVTGYISVLEDHGRGFRVMRCDHSLLGGEWKMSSPPGNVASTRRVGEPIYAIFTMLEAVRLVETPPSSSSKDTKVKAKTKGKGSKVRDNGTKEEEEDAAASKKKKALNIGLGVGTAPSAMIAHGVDTTIIEIDPVVHEFAIKYFGLPHNHTCDIVDAVAAVANRTTYEADAYDYIIHDVFTGGAEPVELFTTQFLSGLRTLLKPDGVIAINYAGDIAMPASSVIHRTITSVFPSCRVFREDEAPAEGGGGDTHKVDFTNMVFFCQKQPGMPITFRKPVEADFLGSGARREYMMPRHEIAASAFNNSGTVDVDVLQSGNTKLLEKYQAQSAIGHWRVMRTVLPDVVWEMW
ncbi:hypothetical protein PV08_04066 [Exophiala spinifera]|uniref:PABS domain-containing protein n=1 Tax=Exophiala spinifera TaxID=91928 RepID=A0A0D1YP05_9EURO|nr:uncharacterized protein PV08_04066 [Exophiala spinifera]KIW16876.1 hypothetical protein PV08_04066 [Exophiala spinifera]